MSPTNNNFDFTIGAPVFEVLKLDNERLFFPSLIAVVWLLSNFAH